MKGPRLADVLVDGDTVEIFTSQRIDTRHTHGTGCTLASAIATRLAQGRSLRDAVKEARAYLIGAITHAPGYGHGAGPLDHGITIAANWIA